MSERSTSAIVGGDGLAVRVMQATDRAVAGDIWRAVESSTPDVLPFEGWDLGRAVAGAVQRCGATRVPRGRARRAPRGAALLTSSVRRYGPLAVRRLHLGTAGEPAGSIFVEYNAICAAEPNRTEVAQVVLAYAHRRGGGTSCSSTASIRSMPRHCWPPSGASRSCTGSPGYSSSAPVPLTWWTSSSRRAPASTVRRSLRGISPYTTEWGAGRRASARRSRRAGPAAPAAVARAG